jgi:histidinol-phosphatase
VNPAWRERYEAAIDCARDAGQIALQYFDTSVKIDWKSDDTPVTVADREAEERLRSRLLARFPRDSFLGEENGETTGDSGFRWIIDPVDATRNYINNVPLWATLVGLEFRDEMIAGVVEAPALRQTWRALRGEGAFRDNRPIHVSSVSDLAKATVYYTSISWFTTAGQEPAFLNLVRKTQTQRGFGDWYGLVLVAQGSGDIMVDHGLKLWDLAAIKPIVEEAGGMMTDWTGRQRCTGPDVLVTNGKLHADTLAILSRTR